MHTNHLGFRALIIDSLDYNEKHIRQFEARHPDSNVLLGFISHNKKTGVVELCNFHAQLQRSAVYLGASTKPYNDNAAGMYGGGLKCAAVLELRNGYQLRITSGEMYWKFALLKTKPRRMLHCTRSYIKTKRIIEKSKQLLRTGTTRMATSNGCIDVSVCIGNVYGTAGRHMSEQTFSKWIRVVLDLHDLMNVVKTSVGWLLLDSAYRSKHYLKGFLLEATLDAVHQAITKPQS